jgi:hypothetical protein
MTSAAPSDQDKQKQPERQRNDQMIVVGSWAREVISL